MSKKVAVILSGCGFMDGAEIRESVISLLALDRAGAIVSMFAPNIDQHEVNDHLSQDTQSETRNVLVESARIARGEVKPLDDLKCNDFDALVIPGGFGVAKNLSDIALKGGNATLLPVFKDIIIQFYRANKPIGAMCIAPAAVALALKDIASPTLTLGAEDANGLIASARAIHQRTRAAGYVVDKAHKIVSCAAYMTDEPLSQIADGIESLITHTLNLA